ncbi:MFS transporter [Jiangella alkaliphila]|uniref:Drug resistance transporter, EmrB/QacA subfamily n=1 Tax=Jiangella alkaliphila TaxID=419479 RepID=A0A1H2K300_9ACTN|nr:MFS transporter [Jiangella alkaliphila]SDU63090.1 drug resistance transporter, EmrB/QacA subfamily [Jiangella alkaliphila]
MTQAPTAPAAAGPAALTPRGSRGQILHSLSGLLLAAFVASLSGTIVSNALPRILDDLGGSQSQYARVVTSTLLTATATAPIWSRLADRRSKRLLFQAAAAFFAAGSVLCGVAPNTELLFVFRAITGVGMGGIGALVYVVLAALISPRERGRYASYVTAVSATATVCGPLLGGLIVDAPLLGWRWCFWALVPLAIGAMLLLQRTLQLPASAAAAKIDWIGAVIIPAAIGVFLAWVTLADRQFGWLSWPSAAFVTATGLLIVVAVTVERRAADPFLPPRLLRRRTMLLALAACVVIGGAELTASVYLPQFFQISMGHTPTASGLMLLPMVAGVVSGTILSGHLVSRLGRYKRHLVVGAVLATIGLALLGTIDRTTPLEIIAGYMVVLGLGLGICLQNLVIAVQNELAYDELGAGTSVVLAFQTLGGAIGIGVLGSVLAAQVAGPAGQSRTILSGDVLIQEAYGDATALMFRLAAVGALVALGAVLLMRDTPLRTTVDGTGGSTEQERPGPAGTGGA